MKTTLALFCAAALTAAAHAQPAAPVREAAFVTPQNYTSPMGCGAPRFRWGWFGAYHHPPAPVMHRDYTQGWRQWYYRR